MDVIVSLWNAKKNLLFVSVYAVFWGEYKKSHTYKGLRISEGLLVS